jgi:hypothetical protein
MTTAKTKSFESPGRSSKHIRTPWILFQVVVAELEVNVTTMAMDATACHGYSACVFRNSVVKVC